MLDLRRREFITVLGGAAAWPLAARAQQAGKVWRIGLLSGASRSAVSGLYDGFVQGMRELGYVPAKASWLSDLKSELLAFPTGRHDDIVDALGLAGQLIDKWAAGPQPDDTVVRFSVPKDFQDYVVYSELEGDSGWTWKML